MALVIVMKYTSNCISIVCMCVTVAVSVYKLIMPVDGVTSIKFAVEHQHLV